MSIGKIIIRNIELDNWTYNHMGELIRCGINSQSCSHDNKSKVLIFRVNWKKDPKLLTAWGVHFYDELCDLESLWKEKYPRYIIGSEKQIKDKVDKFLVKINKTNVFE